MFDVVCCLLRRWSLVYIIFIIHGVGTLLPWNMFLTANSVSDYTLLAYNT